MSEHPKTIQSLLVKIRACQVCAPQLPHQPNPILAASPESKIAVIGQAPGRIVNETGIPWDDKSGANLRQWLGVSHEQFYNSDLFALVPMGFCYPGKGKSGDLPPRHECAPLWHDQLFSHLKNLKLTLLIGQYAQQYYLGDRMRSTLTETVRNHEEYLPDYFVLPHPSPRNNIWRARNSWFDTKLVPKLQHTISNILIN